MGVRWNYLTDEIEDLDIIISGPARITAVYGGRSPITSCTVFPEISQIGLGWMDGTIEVRDIETLEEAVRVKGVQNYSSATFLSSICNGKDENLLMASFESGVSSIWNTSHGQEMWRIRQQRQSLVNGFSCNQEKFAIGGSDAKINVYDVQTQNETQVLLRSMDPDARDGHTQRITSLQFHPSNCNEIISGGWDDTIQFWDIRKPFSNRQILGPRVIGDGIKFVDDSKFITASCIKNNGLQVWDYRSTKLMDDIRPDNYSCFLYCCQYIRPDSLLLAGGMNQNMLRVVQMNTSTTLSTFRELEGAVLCVKELPKQDASSRKINICFCSDKSVYLAEVEAS